VRILRELLAIRVGLLRKDRRPRLVTVVEREA
jgi:hypothetical protein